MQDFRQRRAERGSPVRALLRIVGAVLLLFLTVMAARAAYDMYGRYSRARLQDNAAQSKQRELEEEFSRLQSGVKELQSDRGVEEALRERYGLSRPGESEIRIVRQAPEAPQGGASGFLKRVWNKIFSF